jgi:hypothetical protein
MKFSPPPGTVARAHFWVPHFLPYSDHGARPPPASVGGTPLPAGPPLRTLIGPPSISSSSQADRLLPRALSLSPLCFDRGADRQPPTSHCVIRCPQPHPSLLAAAPHLSAFSVSFPPRRPELAAAPSRDELDHFFAGDTHFLPCGEPSTAAAFGADAPPPLLSPVGRACCHAGEALFPLPFPLP